MQPLLDALADLPEWYGVKSMQANWIGDCSGCFFNHILKVLNASSMKYPYSSCATRQDLFFISFTALSVLYLLLTAHTALSMKWWISMLACERVHFIRLDSEFGCRLCTVCTALFLRVCCVFCCGRIFVLFKIIIWFPAQRVSVWQNWYVLHLCLSGGWSWLRGGVVCIHLFSRGRVRSGLCLSPALPPAAAWLQCPQNSSAQSPETRQRWEPHTHTPEGTDIRCLRSDSLRNIIYWNWRSPTGFSSETYSISTFKVLHQNIFFFTETLKPKLQFSKSKTENSLFNNQLIRCI